MKEAQFWGQQRNLKKRNKWKSVSRTCRQEQPGSALQILNNSQNQETPQNSTANPHAVAPVCKLIIQMLNDLFLL